MNDDSALPVRRPKQEPLVIRVASKTKVGSLATSLLMKLKEGHQLELNCIGPASISQAVKAVAALNGQLGVNGNCALLQPFLRNQTLEDESPSVMVGFRLSVHASS